MCFFFFFQAEDGIRDIGVTGVQTCALPIWPKKTPAMPGISNRRWARGEGAAPAALRASKVPSGITTLPGRNFRVAGFGVASVWMNIGKGLTAPVQGRPGSPTRLAHRPPDVDGRDPNLNPRARRSPRR